MNRRAARWQNTAAPDDLADRLRDFLDGHPESAWDDALRKIAEETAP